MLGGVRPRGDRRSWWLREALAAESSAAPHLAAATPPLRGGTTAGARVVRGPIVRREQLEEREEPVGRVLREVTRLPTRLGYHLGME